MTFQRNVLMVSSVILIIMLLVISYILYQAKLTAKWVPDISQCPDYWKVLGENRCHNVLGLGNDTCPAVQEFNGAEWSGPGGLAKKAEWAENCGVVWDGISDGAYKGYSQEEVMLPGSASQAGLNNMFGLI